MSSLDPVLESATLPWGQRRFYPPGAHPAAAPWRQQIKKMVELGVNDDYPALVHARDLLAAFEEGESLAKMLHLSRYRC